MARTRLAALFFALAIAILLPVVVDAATGNAVGGLVPCGASTGDQATECQACHLVQLAQNIIMFLIGLSIPVAIALFSWAGILYFTSGAGGSENITKAKGIFRSALVGFVLAISAWLIVNTILYTILNNDYKQNSSWFRIDCTERVVSNPGGIQDALNNTLGIAPTKVALYIPSENNPLESGVFYAPSPTLTCDTANGYSLTTSGTCKNAAGQTKSPTIVYAPTEGGSLTPIKLNQALAGTYAYQNQLQAICASEGLSDCRIAQAVMAIESNGNPSASSPLGAYGLMQLLPSTARGLAPATFAGKTDAQIAALLKSDTTLNMTLGVRYLNQLEGTFSTLPNVIAAYNGGPGANKASISCPGYTWWECSANGGYAETRNYVPNVINAMTFLQ